MQASCRRESAGGAGASLADRQRDGSAALTQMHSKQASVHPAHSGAVHAGGGSGGGSERSAHRAYAWASLGHWLMSPKMSISAPSTQENPGKPTTQPNRARYSLTQSLGTSSGFEHSLTHAPGSTSMQPLLKAVLQICSQLAPGDPPPGAGPPPGGAVGAGASGFNAGCSLSVPGSSNPSAGCWFPVVGAWSLNSGAWLPTVPASPVPPEPQAALKATNARAKLRR
jgi:hypothetical protein